MPKQTWVETVARYDVEHYAPVTSGGPEWYLYDGTNPVAIDLGRARWRLTLRLAIWVAYVRRWWKDRRATTQDDGGEHA